MKLGLKIVKDQLSIEQQELLSFLFGGWFLELQAPKLEHVAILKYRVPHLCVTPQKLCL